MKVYIWENIFYKKNIKVADDEEFEGLDPDKPYYEQRLHEISITLTPFLNVNAGHMALFDQEMYKQLVQYPQEVIMGQSFFLIFKFFLQNFKYW